MTTEIAKTETAIPTLRQNLESAAFKAQIAAALPKHLTPDRFIRVACTTIMKTPRLAECDQVSFFNSLLTLSQLGLEPDGRRAHLIPFRNNKRNVVECQLIIDYKGLVELVMNTGQVSNIHADVVCDNDEFEYNLGEITLHKINFRKPRGDMYAAYSICKLKDGTKKCEVMSKDEVEAIRVRSKSANEGPWVTDYNEMSKKTVFRRLSKWLPLTPEASEAIEVDDNQFDRTAQVAAPEFRILKSAEGKEALFPDGAKTESVDEIPMGNVNPPQSAPEPPKQRAPRQKQYPAPHSNPAQGAPATTPPATPSPVAAPAPVEQPKPEPAPAPIPAEEAPETAAQQIKRMMEEKGVPFNDFCDAVHIGNPMIDVTSWKSYGDLPDIVAEKLIINVKWMAGTMRTFGTRK